MTPAVAEPPFRKVLIANRGEIAVRIIRAARELGIGTVQAHSQADADSLAVKLADRAVEIGPPPAAKSYLNADAILDAARRSGADAIHPGYGFLAENADFADAVEAAGLVFVGPKGDAIRLLGDKVTARGIAAEAGVLTVPGSAGRIDDLERARALVETIGFPVMIKAAAGGGGRGIRVANDRAEFDRLAPQASAEARAAFGDGGLYVEKFIELARHVEVQVLGDGERVVHCFERECSLQRRRQKVWEEAPAPTLGEAARRKLCASAVALAGHVGYRGAGTVEFLYDDDTAAFYFIEMNTRIQVEHPVTEMVTGIDLIKEQIRIAAGEPLDVAQEDVSSTGHAIECRVNAEDPETFMPSPGKITTFHPPGGPGIRLDTACYAEAVVSPYYDSMIAKVIARGNTRGEAILRMRRALESFVIEGIKTTIPLQRKILNDEDFVRGRISTAFMERFSSSAEKSPAR
jgi:acetyl-CoA carboxylase biotin carboxylase subunit